MMFRASFFSFFLWFPLFGYSRKKTKRIIFPTFFNPFVFLVVVGKSCCFSFFLLHLHPLVCCLWIMFERMHQRLQSLRRWMMMIVHASMSIYVYPSRRIWGWWWWWKLAQYDRKEWFHRVRSAFFPSFIHSFITITRFANKRMEYRRRRHQRQLWRFSVHMSESYLSTWWDGKWSIFLKASHHHHHHQSRIIYLPTQGGLVRKHRNQQNFRFQFQFPMGFPACTSFLYDASWNIIQPVPDRVGGHVENAMTSMLWFFFEYCKLKVLYLCISSRARRTSAKQSEAVSREHESNKEGEEEIEFA